MKQKKSDVMEVDVEEILPETSLETVIDNTLVKHNVTDAVINSLKEKYGTLKLESVDDKEGYLEIKDARKEVRKVGILCEKITKKGREEAVKVQRLWLDKEKEILSKIAEVQDPLDAEIKKFEDEVERKENEAKQKREEAFIAKQSQLLKYGAEYKNGSYDLGHISYEVEIIKNADEEMWNEIILPKYRKVFEEVEAERVAAEIKRKEEADRLKAEQYKLAEQQRLLKEQQAEFERQMKELQDAKDAADREARLAQQKRDDEERAKRNQMIEKRVKQLQSLGMNFSFEYDAYVFEDVNVDNKTEIRLLDDEEWDALINKISPVIEDKKRVIEEKRLAKIEEDKQAAVAKALEDQKAQQEAIQKQIEEQKRQDELKKQAELEAANDKIKYQNVVEYLLKTPIHIMKSPTYRDKMNIISDFIDGLKN